MAALEVVGIIIISLFAPFLTRALWNYLNSPLKSFPGNSVTLFTNLWRMLDVWSRSAQISHLALYRQHGDAVRMGPNTLMLSDPDLIPEIFNVRKPWRKSDMTKPNDVMVNGMRISNMFSTQDEAWHAKAIKPVGTYYSMARVLDIEVHVDKMLNEIVRIFNDRFADKHDQYVDIAKYTAFFAWDSMRNITFGAPYGLMESGKDEKSIIYTSTRGLEYYAPISQMPQLDYLLDKNPVHRVGPPPLLWATVEAYGEVAQRKAEPSEKAVNRQSDYLDKYIEISKQNPEVVDDNMIVTYLLNNLLAGSDTTAIYMCATFYYLLKNPECLKKVRAELDPAKIQTPVSYRTASSLPYLDACMKEVARMHPAVGIMVERVVPAGGLKLADGRFVPEGTVVGLNPWVTNRVERICGPDPDEFRPERWLKQEGETNEGFAKRLQKMKNGDLTFGAGVRSCIGKNVALLQAYKLVATMLTKFDFKLRDQDKSWRVHNCWFTYVYDVPIRVSTRKS